MYSSSLDLKLYVFSDTGFVGSVDDQKSTSSYVFNFSLRDVAWL